MRYMINLPLGSRLCRQLLLAGATLLACTGNVVAEAPTKAVKNAGLLTVADSVQLAGTTISGGWREYASDDSWRRVTFTLDGNVGTITFGDGLRGRRLPSATRYAYAGFGPKNEKVSYDEVHIFANPPPALKLRADQSSPIPGDIAARIRSLGGDIRSLQHLADISQRMTDIGSAFDAARRPAGGGAWGFPGELPGSGTRGKPGKWADPRGGVGHDGRASDDVEQVTTQSGGDGTSTTIVTRHDDGSSTTLDVWTKTDSQGSTTGTSTTERDKNDEITRGSTSTTDTSTGTRTDRVYEHDASTGEVRWKQERTYSDGIRIRTHGTYAGTPSETGYSRGAGHEAELAQRLPWLIEINYINWKRGNDLVRSGGLIAQPGEQPAPAPGDTPAVGANAAVNCGDSNTNPCAGESSAALGTDVRGGFGSIAQPGRGEPGGVPLVPIGGTIPLPSPPPPPK